MRTTSHFRSGEARTDSFASLRAVDAKVREVKMILRDAGASAGLKRWQTTAGTALKFLETRVLKQKKQLFRGPDLTRITGIMPDLEPIIQARWLEAQRCQHAGAYVAAVVMMGSILEALLLARSSLSPGEAYQAKSAPRDRVGKSVALHDWSLSTLVDVAGERGWIKSDRGNFSHAGR